MEWGKESGIERRMEGDAKEHQGAPLLLHARGPLEESSGQKQGLIGGEARGQRLPAHHLASGVGARRSRMEGGRELVPGAQGWPATTEKRACYCAC